VPRGTPRAGALLTLLFFLSGACGLVYQVVWVRMLVLVFGASVPAVATVVSAFMAGLALGAWAFGRIADRRPDGLRLYAALELGIGLFAVAFPALLAGAQRAAAAGVVRFVLVFLVLLVPTTLMGGTLPVLGRAVVRRLERFGRDIGWLYTANTFGAAFGCSFVALVLLERLGLWRTILATAAVNGLVAATALLLARRRADAAGAPAPVTPAALEPVRPLAARLVFWGFALSGCAALGYEVLWTRVLSIVMRLTTTESLSAILVVFLVGLASGGAAGTRLADRFRRPALAFGLLQIVLGLLVLLSVPVLAAAPHLLAALGPAYGFGGHVLRIYAVGFAVMLPATFILGLLFPLAGRIHVAGRRSLGAGLGEIYGANTAGAIAGPLLAGLVLLPWLGVQRAIQVLAWTHLAIGAATLAADRPARPGPRAGGLALAALAALAATALVPHDAIVGAFRPPQGELLYHDEDAAGTVTVARYPDGSRMLRVNGAGEVPTDLDSIRTFRLLGNLPMVLHPGPQRVLVVAFGGGITLDAVDRHAPADLACVEIAPAVVGAAPWFEPWNAGVWRRLGPAGIRLIRQDGRNHLLHTDERYDAIIGDATHPASADSWLLYTREFYELCASRLAPGGVLAQWLPLHGLTAADFRTVLRTFRQVFPHATLWLTPGYSVLVATPGPLRPDLERMRAALAAPRVRAGLAEVGLDDPVSLLGTLALDEVALAQYAGAGPLNTDDLPRVGFGDRTRGGTLHGVPVLADLLPRLVSSFAAEIAGADRSFVGLVDRRLAARRYTLAGVLSRITGDRAAAEDAWRRALAIDPSEPEARRLLAASGGRNGTVPGGRP
jgi:spermidine synthase